MAALSPYYLLLSAPEILFVAWCSCSWQLAPECGSSLLLRSARAHAQQEVQSPNLFPHLSRPPRSLLGEIPGINKNT